MIIAVLNATTLYWERGEYGYISVLIVDRLERWPFLIVSRCFLSMFVGLIVHMPVARVLGWTGPEQQRMVTFQIDL